MVLSSRFLGLYHRQSTAVPLSVGLGGGPWKAQEEGGNGVREMGCWEERKDPQFLATTHR